MIQLSFELARGRKFKGEQIKTIEGLRLGIIGLIVALGNLMFLKLAYLPLKLRFSDRYLF